MYNPSEPYNALPPLPPKAEVETVAVLKKAITANKFLAELKGSCERLPKPEILLNTVVLQESKESSAIENVVTTQDELYKAILMPAEEASAETKEVLRYREAIYTGIDYLNKKQVFTTQMSMVVMQQLRGITTGLREHTGTKLANPLTSKTIYTPPDPVELPDKMSEWEKFANADNSYDPLVKMALMHYQFEAIHPFSDGNGRTGRILNILYLMYEGLLTQPVLYHSAFIIQHKTDYYRLLREVTEKGNWHAWIIFMLEAIAETAQQTLLFIERMLILKAKTLDELRHISQKIPAFELNELLFTHPYLKIKTLIDNNLGTRPTVTAYLEALSKRNILVRKKIGRENYYINENLMNLLTQGKEV